MSFEVARKSIDFLVNELQNSNKKQKGNVTFFGGEPLLNWELLQEIVRYAKDSSKGVGCRITFSLTTNGTLLDEDKVAYIRANRIATDISIDSHDESINDELRPFKSGKGSYKKILENLRLFKEGDPVGVKATIMPTNLRISDYFIYFSGIQTLKSITFCPVFAMDESGYFSDDDINQYKTELNKYVNYLVENWSKGNILNPESNHLDFIRSLALQNDGKSKNACSAASSSIVVYINGDIYPCEPLVGNHDFYLGNIFSGIEDVLRSKMIDKIIAKNKKGCMGCSARDYCGESCIYCAMRMEMDSAPGNRARQQLVHCNYLAAEVLLETINVLSATVKL